MNTDKVTSRPEDPTSHKPPNPEVKILPSVEAQESPKQSVERASENKQRQEISPPKNNKSDSISVPKETRGTEPPPEMWRVSQPKGNYQDRSEPQDKKKQSTHGHGVHSTTPIDSPIDKDVLFARGGLTNHHPGNKRLRELVKEFKMRYDKSNKRVKTEISQYIVDKIRGEGGRFLKRDDNTNLWNVVQNNEARRKASQSLRDCHQYGKKKFNEIKTSASSSDKRRQPTSPTSTTSSSDTTKGNVPNKMLYLLSVVSHERTQEHKGKA